MWCTSATSSSACHFYSDSVYSASWVEALSYGPWSWCSDSVSSSATSSLQPLFSAHCVLHAPRWLSHQVREVHACSRHGKDEASRLRASCSVSIQSWLKESSWWLAIDIIDAWCGICFPHKPAILVRIRVDLVITQALTAQISSNLMQSNWAVEDHITLSMQGERQN